MHLKPDRVMGQTRAMESGNGAQQDKPAADAKKPAGTDAQDAADAAAKDGGTPTGNSGKEKQGEAGKEASKQDAEKSGANEIAPLAAGGLMRHTCFGL
jgi:uncharacterized membrane-anchored protein